MNADTANALAELLRDAGMIAQAQQTGGSIWVASAICPVNHGEDYRYLLVDENGLTLYRSEVAQYNGEDPLHSVWW